MIRDLINSVAQFFEFVCFPAVTVPIESDSFTDNPAATKSQKPQRRHKRRMKKMAIDMSPGCDLIGADQVGVKTVATDIDGENGTLTRKKTSSDSTKSSSLTLDVAGALSATTASRRSPWKSVPFKFSSEHAFNPSIVIDESSNQTMEFDGQSSNTLSGPHSGTLNTSSISNQLVMSDVEGATEPWSGNLPASRTVSDGEITEKQRKNSSDSVGDVFINSDNDESSLSSSSRSQDEVNGGIFTGKYSVQREVSVGLNVLLF